MLARRVGYITATVVAVVLGLGWLPLRCDAQLIPAGSEFQVNTYTTNGQWTAFSGKRVAHTADGGFVIVWDSHVGGSDVDVIAQRYDATGTPLGTEFRVNSHLPDGQFPAALVATVDGGFVVVWESRGQDGSGSSVECRRYDGSGAALGTEFQVNVFTTSTQGSPSVAARADGGFAVVWTSLGQDGDGNGVFGRRYDPAGAPLGTEFQVNTDTTGGQDTPHVASDGDGALVVTWEAGINIRAQRYAADGLPAGTEFQVNTYTTSGFRSSPRAAWTADGGFTVVWQSSSQDGSGSSVHGQRYDASGATVGGEFQINSYTTSSQGDPVIVADGDDGFVVAWDGGTPGDVGGVAVRKYDGSGTPVDAEFTVNTYTTHTQYLPSIASDGNGNFVVVWTGPDGGGSAPPLVTDAGVYGRLLCSDANNDTVCDPPPPLEPCSAAPEIDCVQAAQAKLDVKETNAGKESLKLQWKKLADETSQAGFGEPVAGTTVVVLCIYDDADDLVQAYVVDRAGDTCAGTPCWQAKGTTGLAYGDKDAASDGISKLSYGSGDAGKGKAAAKGKNNAAKGQASLPTGVASALAGSTMPTIQLQTSDGFCTSATLTTVTKDEGSRYSALRK